MKTLSEISTRITELEFVLNSGNIQGKEFKDKMNLLRDLRTMKIYLETCPTEEDLRAQKNRLLARIRAIKLAVDQCKSLKRKKELEKELELPKLNSQFQFVSYLLHDVSELKPA